MPLARPGARIIVDPIAARTCFIYVRRIRALHCDQSSSVIRHALIIANPRPNVGYVK